MSSLRKENEETVYIYTDGACKGNPGPGGWAAILRYKQVEKELWGAEPETTNNRMELMAVIMGLKALKWPSWVVVVTDSQYVQKGMTLWIHRWKQQGFKTKSGENRTNHDLWKRLDSLSSEHRVSWEWVRGHHGHPENERADELANKAIDELLARER